MRIGLLGVVQGQLAQRGKRMTEHVELASAEEAIALAHECLQQFRRELSDERTTDFLFRHMGEGIGEVAGLIKDRFKFKAFYDAFSLEGVNQEQDIVALAIDLHDNMLTSTQKMKETESMEAKKLFNRIGWGSTLFWHLARMKHLSLYGPHQLRDNALRAAHRLSLLAQSLAEVTIDYTTPTELLKRPW